MTRPQPFVFNFLSLVCFLLFASSLGAACSKDKRQTTIRTSLVAVNAASAGYLEYDHRTQQAIVERATTREMAVEGLAEHRTKRAGVIDTFVVVYRMLAVAATQTDQPSLDTAVAAASDLVAEVTKIIQGEK